MRTSSTFLQQTMCAVFERAVKSYVKRSHNCKGVEGTLAKAEACREFLKSLEEGDDECDTSQVGML